MVRGHGVEKATERGATLVAATPHPMHGDADDGATEPFNFWFRLRRVGSILEAHQNTSIGPFLSHLAAYTQGKNSGFHGVRIR